MRWLMAATLVLFVAGACERQPTEPVTSGVAPVDGSPTLDDWSNNPDNGNLRIFRGGTHWAMCWNDSDSPLRACHATVPLGGGSEPDCGLQGLGEQVEFQEVLIDEQTDDGAPFDRVGFNLKGDVFITVRDQSIGGDCFGSEVVAEGWGQFHYTDNDLFGTTFGEDNNYTNSFGFRANGRLTTPAGDMVAYNGHLKFVFRVRADGTIELDQKSRKAELH